METFYQLLRQLTIRFIKFLFLPEKFGDSKFPMALCYMLCVSQNLNTEGEEKNEKIWKNLPQKFSDFISTFIHTTYKKLEIYPFLHIRLVKNYFYF